MSLSDILKGLTFFLVLALAAFNDNVSTIVLGGILAFGLGIMPLYVARGYYPRVLLTHNQTIMLMRLGVVLFLTVWGGAVCAVAIYLAGGLLLSYDFGVLLASEWLRLAVLCGMFGGIFYLLSLYVKLTYRYRT